MAGGTPEQRHAWREDEYRKLKRDLFDHYGWQCACCGSADQLTIDHVNGDGAAHRAAVSGDPRGKRGADKVWREIRRLGFPPGYQTLCRACNNSKRGGRTCKLHHGDIRVDAALILREAGWTFAAIGLALGISRARAYQLCTGQWAHPTPSHSE